MKETITDLEIEKIADKYAKDGVERLAFEQEAKAYRKRLQEQSAKNRRSAFRRAIGMPDPTPGAG